MPYNRLAGRYCTIREKELTSIMKQARFKAGQVIIAEGTFGDQTFFIRSGQVAIYKEAGHGKRIQIAELGAEEVFGEMYLLDKDGFRSVTAIAQMDVQVVVCTDDRQPMIKNLY